MAGRCGKGISHVLKATASLCKLSWLWAVPVPEYPVVAKELWLTACQYFPMRPTHQAAANTCTEYQRFSSIPQLALPSTRLVCLSCSGVVLYDSNTMIQAVFAIFVIFIANIQLTASSLHAIRIVEADLGKVASCAKLRTLRVMKTKPIRV